MLFVPAAVPPHKPAAELASAEHRYRMTALAIREHPRFAVSEIELRREGPSYTVDTLSAPGRRDDAPAAHRIGYLPRSPELARSARGGAPGPAHRGAAHGGGLRSGGAGGPEGAARARPGGVRRRGWSRAIPRRLPA